MQATTEYHNHDHTHRPTCDPGSPNKKPSRKHVNANFPNAGSAKPKSAASWGYSALGCVSPTVVRYQDKVADCGVGAGSKHSEVQLPLEVDETAPPLHGKMAHPSLADVNYMLNRWAHAWDRQRDVALRARAAMETEARPATPFKSLRALEADPLYGYPLAPEP